MRPQRSSRPPRPYIPPRRALSNLRKVVLARRTWLRLLHKLRHERIFMRSSALAFETLLSIVPLTAVAMAAVRAFGGRETQNAMLRFLAGQYVPESANAAVERFIVLVGRLDLSTVGLVGLVAFIPVMFSLIDAVELALSDIFRTPRRTHWWRLLVLGGLLTLAPLGSVLTVRYIHLDALAYDHVLTPLLLVTGLLYAIFRTMPSVSTSDRASLFGALTTGVLLSLSKAAFGLYATKLATGIHLLWGAIAFVPLLLVWVLVAWCVVLLGAVVTAVLQSELNDLELAPELPRAFRSPRRRRLRRRLLARRRARVSTLHHPAPPHPAQH